MKRSTELVLGILKKNAKESIRYFREIALGDSCEAHFGFTDDSISLMFIIKGKKQGQSLCISKKLDYLFSSTSDLEALDAYLPKVQNPLHYHFCPYLKISSEPEIHVCRIGIDHQIN